MKCLHVGEYEPKAVENNPLIKGATIRNRFEIHDWPIEPNWAGDVWCSRARQSIDPSLRCVYLEIKVEPLTNRVVIHKIRR